MLPTKKRQVKPMCSLFSGPKSTLCLVRVSRVCLAARDVSLDLPTGDLRILADWYGVLSSWCREEVKTHNCVAGSLNFITKLSSKQKYFQRVGQLLEMIGALDNTVFDPNHASGAVLLSHKLGVVRHSYRASLSPTKSCSFPQQR